MKIIFSPSKSQSSSRLIDTKIPQTAPLFPEKTNVLFDNIKSLSFDELQKIFKTSDIKTNEILDIIHNKQSIKIPSIHMFTGTSYKELDQNNYSSDQQDYLANNVVILSALYGVLRPFDTISSYRLDMNDALFRKNTDYNNLYVFWHAEVNSYFEKKETIINLASKEYSQILDNKKFNIINFHFLSKQNGIEKNISVYAKQQRGALLNYIVYNKISDVKFLTEYSHQGYYYEHNRSDANNYYFLKEI